MGTRLVASFPGRSVIGEKSAWYPLFMHARAVLLHTTPASRKAVEQGVGSAGIEGR